MTIYGPDFRPFTVCKESTGGETTYASYSTLKAACRAGAHYLVATGWDAYAAFDALWSAKRCQFYNVFGNEPGSVFVSGKRF